MFSNYCEKNKKKIPYFIFYEQIKISNMRVKWWTPFGGSKSMGVCITIYACNAIILKYYVKSKCIYSQLTSSTYKS